MKKQNHKLTTAQPCRGLLETAIQTTANTS